MSLRPRIAPDAVIVNGSMASTLTSTPTIIQSIPDISYTCSWTGSPTGSFSVQVSNDYSLYANGQVNNAGTWTSLPLGGTTSVTATSGTAAFDIRNTGFYAIKLVYTASSGTGVLNATVAGKVE